MHRRPSEAGRGSADVEEVWVELKTAVFRKLMSVDGPALSEDEARKYRALSRLLSKVKVHRRPECQDETTAHAAFGLIIRGRKRITFALLFHLLQPTRVLCKLVEDVVLRSGFNAEVADRAAVLLADMAAGGELDD